MSSTETDLESKTLSALHYQDAHKMLDALNPNEDEHLNIYIIKHLLDLNLGH